MSDFFDELRKRFREDKDFSLQDFSSMLKDALNTQEKAEATYKAMKEKENDSKPSCEEPSSKMTLQEAYDKLEESSTDPEDIHEVQSMEIDFPEVANIIMFCLKNRTVFRGSVSERITEVAHLFNVDEEAVTSTYANFKSTGVVDDKFAEELSAGVRNSDKTLPGYIKLTDNGFKIYTTVTHKLENNKGEKTMTEEEIKNIVAETVKEELSSLQKFADATTDVIIKIQERLDKLQDEQDDEPCHCCDCDEDEEPPYDIDPRVSDDAVRFIMLGVTLCDNQEELVEKILKKFNIDEEDLAIILGSATGDTTVIAYYIPEDIVKRCAMAWNKMKDRLSLKN